MRKFDLRFKLKVVRDYLAGKGGYKILAAKYGIANSLVRSWVAAYQHHGSAGLWRDPISDLGKRENELAGKTLMVVGFGRIGQRVAALAKAFGMSVIAVKRDLTQGTDMADKVVSQDRVVEMAAISDFIVLTCPLNASTENLIDEHVFRAMRPTAFLVNVARGKVVHEPALLQALRERRIAGAALDCVWEEPLPADSPLWELDNALITPHVGGETARFEDALLDVFLENLDRLYAGRSDLINLVT